MILYVSFICQYVKCKPRASGDDPIPVALSPVAYA